MKKILYILLTLSILSVGCSKEDDDTIQVTQETTSNLDSDLYGIWKEDPGTYTRSFSSNGKWGFWINNDSPYGEIGGDWWVEQDKVFLQWLTYNSSSGGSYIATDIYDYSVLGNTLILVGGNSVDTSTWIKQ
jgi:hypothetical protein